MNLHIKLLIGKASLTFCWSAGRRLSERSHLSLRELARKKGSGGNPVRDAGKKHDLSEHAECRMDMPQGFVRDLVAFSEILAFMSVTQD